MKVMLLHVDFTFFNIQLNLRSNLLNLRLDHLHSLFAERVAVFLQISHKNLFFLSAPPFVLEKGIDKFDVAFS